MVAAVADTHAVIWYLYDDPRLSVAARKVFEDAVHNNQTIGVSAISLIEIVYLLDKGRIKEDVLPRLLVALNDSGAILVELPVDRTVADKMRRVSIKKVPDMPDRIIAATALSQSAPLISRDRKIRISGIATIW